MGGPSVGELILRGLPRLLMSQMAEPRKDRIFYCLGGVHGKIWSKNDVQDEGEGKADVCVTQSLRKRTSGTSKICLSGQVVGYLSKKNSIFCALLVKLLLHPSRPDRLHPLIPQTEGPGL